MKVIRKVVGWHDRYGKGRVVYIDFTYSDWIVVWIEYRTFCRAFLAVV